MNKRHVYSGGNTCKGFYHFYDTMVNDDVERKIVLKGGPGVGKSSFMNAVGEHFAKYDLEYHWCSSDPHSLDGIVIGDNQICLVDGTKPHIIDPKYPGAVDEIVNLGQFWDRKSLNENRRQIVSLTNHISKIFKLAYLRLHESSIACEEMKFYISEAVHWPSVAQNVLALSDDFMAAGKTNSIKARHLFAAAITPAGVMTKIDSIIDSDYIIFAVSGSPGSGVQHLFRYLLHQIQSNSIHAEIYHNPFDPDEIDLIILPESKTVLVDISDNVVDYAPLLPDKFKRRLDFNLFVQNEVFADYENDYKNALVRYKKGLDAAIGLLAQAKALHDELEAFYIPHMDFEAMTNFRTSLITELKQVLTGKI
ncbi:MAG: hypothetical protein GX808_01825 [Syntrophomonadaceae bacterium]|nr:hypothetical protein [Syntrophomonadaceae bacterium]